MKKNKTTPTNSRYEIFFPVLMLVYSWNILNAIVIPDGFNQTRKKTITSSPRISREISEYEVVTFYEIFSDEEILLFKNVLKLLGYDIDTENPNWTSEDSKDVEEFQTNYNILIDGKIGPQTLTAMSYAITDFRNNIQGLDLRNIGSSRYINIREPEKLRIGDIIKYFHIDYDKWKFARVTKISDDNIVSLYDWSLKETFTLKMEDIDW